MGLKKKHIGLQWYYETTLNTVFNLFFGGGGFCQDGSFSDCDLHIGDVGKKPGQPLPWTVSFVPSSCLFVLDAIHTVSLSVVFMYPGIWASNWIM